MEARGSPLVVALVVLLASAPVLAAPSASTFPTLPHAPIRIASDADFTAANGVVAGSGTPLDPFLVAGWHIAAGSGAAISITNTTLAFVVKENVVDAPTGISVTADASWSALVDNQVIVEGTGILVSDASPAIQDNSLIVSASARGTTRAIVATQSDAAIQGNAIDHTTQAVFAEQGSPAICGNDANDVVLGVWIHDTTNATVCGNTVTGCLDTAIYVQEDVGAVVSGNAIDTCQAGIQVWAAKDVNVTANLVVRAALYGVKFESSSGVVDLNTIVDGWGDGIELWHSPLLFLQNNVSNNLGVGFYSENSGAILRDNLATRNGVGVKLSNLDVVHLEGNLLANNTVGLDIPYDSRQSIPWMQGNIVNGVNVDGALRPDERVFFYKAANVSILGGVRDSGFSQGYYGSISAEGNVVLYEVDTARIEGALIGHADVGVTAVNSFNVVVNGTSIAQARVGVAAYGASPGAPGGEYGTVGEVPPCVVSVKNATISIPVDPAGTIGVASADCATLVLDSTISLVDTGVRAEGSGSLALVGSTILGAKVGVSAAVAELNLTGDVVAEGKLGVVQEGASGAYVDDRVRDNLGPGLVLADGAHARLLGNVFSANGKGVADAQPCGAAYSCGSLDAAGNVFTGNLGDGVAINGTSAWRGDVFQGNQGDGARLGDATLLGVNASGNGQDGVELRGTFLVRGSAFAQNGRHGAYLVGSGDVRASAFRDNVQAGIRASPAYITAYDLDVSRNFDGILLDGGDALAAPSPAVPPVSVQGVWSLAGGLQTPSADVLDVHHSSLVGNERDAIRAGVASVNATSDYWGSANGPAISVADQVGAYQNGVGPTVRFVPYYEDPALTTTGPVPLL